MTRLVFNWPDEASEAVRAARGRVEVAGERLAERDFEDRLNAVVEIVASWSRPDSPWRRELIQRLGSTSSFDPRTLEEGLESALRAWDPAALAACARREITNVTGDEGPRLAPYRCTSVLAGGVIPMPTLLSGLLPLILGSPVLMRETSADPVTGELLARSIAAYDEGLGACFEVVRFRVEDDDAMRAFLSAPCIVATGSDETMAAIRARLDEGQRFVAYGHRFSIAALGPRTCDGQADLGQIAEGLALDIARWDQLGCLSPIDVYLVGLETENRLRIARSLAGALERLTGTMPRGGHPNEALAAHALERSEARMRAAVAGEAGLFIDGNDFAVSLETDAAFRPAPLLRFVHLLPVASLAALEQALLPLSHHLSNVAIAGFDPRGLKQAMGTMTHLGFNRVCVPGRTQTPPIDWPHDGMPLLLPMARFLQWDGSPLTSAPPDTASDSDA